MAEQNVIRIDNDTGRYNTRPAMAIPFDEAVDNLANSSFMDAWIKKQIARHLESGGTFELEREGLIAVTYRMAKPGEITELLNRGALAPPETMEQRAERRVKRAASGVEYVFKLPPAGKKRDKAFEDLQKQGRVLLELVAESGHERLNVEALRQVLESGRERIKTKPERDLIVLFRFHFGEFYSKMGLVEKVERDKVEESSDEPSDEE